MKELKQKFRRPVLTPIMTKEEQAISAQKNKELIARIHTERAMKKHDVRPDDYFPGDQMTGKQMYDAAKKMALERMASPDYDISQLMKNIKKQNPRQQFYSDRKMYKPPTGQ